MAGGAVGDGQTPDLESTLKTETPSFTDSGQNLGDSRTFALAAGDGDSRFSASSQNLGGTQSRGMAVADLDSDRDLDVFIGMIDGFSGNRLYLCTIPSETVRKPSGRVAPQ